MTATYTITDRAMLCTLTIKQWSARKTDKKASKEVSDNHGSDESWGRYNKSLIAKTALQTIQQIATQARTYHYDHTLPWSDQGARILPATMYMEYTTNMRTYRNAFDAAARDLVDNYPSLVQDARASLNGLFNPADYPEAADIAERFSFAVACDPMPTADDFRVSLDATVVEALRADITARTEARIFEAVNDAKQRLLDAVRHAAAKLADPKAIFRDSLIGNLDELCRILPKLNFTADPDLDAAVQDVRNAIAMVTPQALRDNDAVRQDTAAKAAAIAAKMAAFMG